MNLKQRRRNFFIIGQQDFYTTKNNKINEIVKIINSDKLAILNGMRNIGKLNFIKELLSITGVNNNYFYFNKSDDIENFIADGESLNNLLNEYIQLYKKPNIIILQNIGNINGIKEFIEKIYGDGHKILLVGNSIKIGGIKEIEILNIYNNEDLQLDNIIKYGNLRDIKSIESDIIKKNYLKNTTSDIFTQEIFNIFSVKNISLYYFTLTYLAYNNTFVSLRELQKNLDSINNISLKTLIDYVNFSMRAKIIKRVYKYDLKKKKEITSKAKYYFTDNGIRNSLANFDLNNKILVENLIFNILEYNNYTIYSGVNGKFDFSFYIEKENKPLINVASEDTISIEKKYIHISRQTTKEELRKEVNKLLKIGKEGKKYLIVDSIEKLGIKKLRYDSVEILEVKEFIIKFLK